MQPQTTDHSGDTQIELLNVSDHPQFMDHEKVFKITGGEVTAFVGVHNTALGPAIGGIRYKQYDSEFVALHDVLRLSEAMTWKNSAVGLENGGGKSVIMAHPDHPKPYDEALRVMAEGLNLINADKPIYFGAQDMNIGAKQIDFIYGLSNSVVGYTVHEEGKVSGDPAPLTAMGVFECIKIAVQEKLGRDDLNGVRVSLQGLGSVGYALAEFLHGEGAALVGCDTNDAVFDALAADGVEVQKVGLDAIFDTPADIFAPNAIGGILSDDNVHRLQKAGVQIVCGAANNQQEDQSGGTESKLMHSLGMLYCPDYIVNGGGVYWVAKVGQDAAKTRAHIRQKVAGGFEDVLALAKDHPETDMATLARRYAEGRVSAAS